MNSNMNRQTSAGRKIIKGFIVTPPSGKADLDDSDEDDEQGEDDDEEWLDYNQMSKAIQSGTFVKSGKAPRTGTGNTIVCSFKCWTQNQ
jgi:hypothetical protein